MTTPSPARVPAPYRQPHPAPHRSKVGPWARWFALLGAPAAWCLQSLVLVPIISHACYPSDLPLESPLWGHLRLLSGGIEAVAALVCIAAGITGWRNWRLSHDEKPGGAHHLVESGDGRTRFLAMAGMLSSGLFLMGVALAAANLAAVSPCGG